MVPAPRGGAVPPNADTVPTSRAVTSGSAALVWPLARGGGSWATKAGPLSNDEDLKVRYVAASTLGHIGASARDALPFLRDKLRKGDRADYVHRSVRAAIQKIDDPERAE